MATAYLAAADFETELTTELGPKTLQWGSLFLTDQPAQNVAWAEDIWFDVQKVTFNSIADAAKILRDKNLLWQHVPIANVRRGELIAEKLPKLKLKPIIFPSHPEKRVIGCFALIDQNTLLFSNNRSRAWPAGKTEFVENKIDPPSRAYLKLWEALTLFGDQPKPGERCVDLGACPGGWSWVLLQLGAKVTAVDKAPLDEKITRHKNLTTRQESAFGLSPKDFGEVDWLFSDVICYPDKLYELVKKWLDSGLAKHIIVTVKFQGETDFATMKKFQALPDSKLLHLHHNKHELTWLWPITNSHHTKS